MEYVVSLRSPAQEADKALSFSNGRHGFTVRASSPELAVAAAVERAKREGFYGLGWSARIVELDRPGGRVGLCSESDRYVYLADCLDDETASWRETIGAENVRLGGGGIEMR